MISGRLPTGAEVLTFFQHDKGVEVANHVTKGRTRYSDWFSGEPSTSISTNVVETETTNTTIEQEYDTSPLEDNLKVDFENFTATGSVIYMDKEKIDTAERYIEKIRSLDND